jgi:hypothetical protein
MCSGANRWKAANRSAKKLFLQAPRPRRGWAKIKTRKSKNPKSQNRKNRIGEFWILRKKKGKPKIQEIARAAFMPVPECLESPSAGRISIPPLTASYLL